MVIAHNMKAMNADRQLNIVTSDKAKSSEKLSSGYRINRAADDAAGLSISEKMRHQIRGLYRGANNIEEGVGYCQVADGALNEMHDMLQRMNELCIQAANGTLSDTDRGYIDEEVQLLKAEVDRTCRTTKFNEEYIFRCEDVEEEKPHDVYKLSFTGTPKDLFIYNSSYDADDAYEGVVFRGRRYTWDEINPLMYDKTTHEFREGEYSIRADDDTVLTLICEKGAKLPQVSRKFRTSADGRGIYVNDDLVSWNNVKVAGDQYSFDYHGMRISYTKEAGDSFEDMMLKMTGTVWESTYEAPVESRSVDATFTFGTVYEFMNNTRIQEYLKGKNIKYIIHAEDINDNGTIPYHNPDGSVEYIPFDGIWIEATDEKWNPTNRALWKMTWGEFQGNTVEDRAKLDTIPGKENFGFTCDEDHGKYDWGNLSTDIWVGDYPKKDPDEAKPNQKYPADIQSNDFAEYDPYDPFNFINVGDQNEKVNFYFSVINEVSKEQAIKALDRINIYYPEIKPHDRAEVQTSGNNRVVNTNSSRTDEGKGLNLILRDEYNLGRDYENGKAEYVLKDYAQLNYANGTFSVSYGYDRVGGNMTLSGASSFNINTLKHNIITDGTIQGNRLTASNTNPNINISLSSASGSTLTLNYNYNISNFFAGGGAVISEREGDPNGTYAKVNGKYVNYTWVHEQQGLPRYSVDIKSETNQSLENYFTTTVYPEIAAASEIRLNTNNYPTDVLTGKENYVSAMVTRWQTPFQHPHVIPFETPPEKPEYLRIQCSSNVTDVIWIQKQKLSAYRLGLSNVGTLSEMQATGAIDMVGAALSKLSSVRSLFGAEQNRLEHAYAINQNTHENTQSAESAIRDTDMAKEMVRFSNASILEQSGNSMLVQANQANNIVLSLLQ